MLGKIILSINGKETTVKSVKNWKNAEQLTETFKSGMIKTLSPSDTWEIAIVIESNFESKSRRKIN